MKSYQIPNSDGNSRLTKNLRYNYRKYRTMLHCIYLKKDSFTIDDEQVIAHDEAVLKECGIIVNKSMNQKCNSTDWKKYWAGLAKDNVFIFHCKEMMNAPDIIEYLNGILPCGITRGMQVIMLLGESLKKCHAELTKQLSTDNPSSTVQESLDYLEKWLKHLEKKGPRNFIVPKVIYSYAQKYAIEESPNFEDVISSLIPSYRGCHLFQPYVWAAVMEQFRETNIELPVYKPLRALLAPERDEMDLLSSEESDREANNTDEKEKQNLTAKVIPQKLTEKDKRAKKRKNPSRPSENMHSAPKISGSVKDMHNTLAQYAASPQATITIPLISGMVVEGLEFKIRIKSFRVEHNIGLETPRDNHDAAWNPQNCLYPSINERNFNNQQKNVVNHPYDSGTEAVATSSNGYCSARPSSNGIEEIRAVDLIKTDGNEETSKIIHEKSSSQDQGSEFRS